MVMTCTEAIAGPPQDDESKGTLSSRRRPDLGSGGILNNLAPRFGERGGDGRRLRRDAQFGRLSFFKSAPNRGSWCTFFIRGSTFIPLRWPLRRVYARSSRSNVLSNWFRNAYTSAIWYAFAGFAIS